mmetsp:Transcript_59397/g.141675  ORF Transcript_59397/g.141675 Transcript_59397/m.141675 type:complete len:179 (+) Transcript_59397:1632-2168(+)
MPLPGWTRSCTPQFGPGFDKSKSKPLARSRMRGQEPRLGDRLALGRRILLWICLSHSLSAFPDPQCQALGIAETQMRRPTSRAIGGLCHHQDQFTLQAALRRLLQRQRHLRRDLPDDVRIITHSLEPALPNLSSPQVIGKSERDVHLCQEMHNSYARGERPTCIGALAIMPWTLTRQR